MRNDLVTMTLTHTIICNLRFVYLKKHFFEVKNVFHGAFFVSFWPFIPFVSTPLAEDTLLQLEQSCCKKWQKKTQQRKSKPGNWFGLLGEH